MQRCKFGARRWILGYLIWCQQHYILATVDMFTSASCRMPSPTSEFAHCAISLAQGPVGKLENKLRKLELNLLLVLPNLNTEQSRGVTNLGSLSDHINQRNRKRDGMVVNSLVYCAVFLWSTGFRSC